MPNMMRESAPAASEASAIGACPIINPVGWNAKPVVSCVPSEPLGSVMVPVATSAMSQANQWILKLTGN